MTDPETYRYRVDQMRLESVRWREAADRMRTAYLTIRDDLNLTADDFSGQAAELGVADTYTELKEEIERFVGEGAKEYEHTADSLDEVARRIVRTEEAAAEQLRRIQADLERLGLR